MTLDHQSGFSRALLDAGVPIPEGLKAWNGDAPSRRFGVYRNNVMLGLVGAVASRFPAAEKIVGEEFFAAMARDFVLAHPPRSPHLLAYGEDFAEFVEAFEPAATVPYLPDVIRLENARSRAYHAADHPPLSAADLSGISPGALGDLRFTPHPSASVVRSQYPIVSIWAMNSGEMPLEPLTSWEGQDALVVRPEMIVNVHELPPGGGAFASVLFSGGSLSTAVEAASRDRDAFDLTMNLVGILQAGALATVG